MPIKYNGAFNPEIGMRIFLSAFISDDANSPGGSGSNQVLLVGEYGSGKSTLMVHLAQDAVYLERGSKKQFIYRYVHNLPIDKFKIRNTTVLWRIRDADYFPSFFDGNSQKCFPGRQCKKAHIFIHEEDAERITFFRFGKDKKPEALPNMPEIETYKDTPDLVDKIHEGHINCILEYQQYRLSSELNNAVLEATAEYVGKQVDDKAKDELDSAQKKPGRGRPRKIKDFTQHAIRAAVMWVDIYRAIMTRWGSKPIAIFCDEFDDALPQICSGPHWHVAQAWSQWARDFRKLNISSVISTHGWGLLHPSVYARCNVKLMMRGTKKSEANTQIRYTRSFSNLDTGLMIADNGTEFGIAPFSKIDYLVQGRVDGLIGSSPAFSAETAKEIRAQYSLKSPIEQNAEIKTEEVMA